MNSLIDRSLNNYPIAPYIRSQILGDELYEISNRDIYSRCRIGVAADTVNPVAPTFVRHGLPNIYTLDENCGIWILATRIRRRPNITHRSPSEHNVGEGTKFGEAFAYYIRKNIRLILKFGTKIPNFKAIAKILKQVDHLWIQFLLVQTFQMQKHQKQTLQQVKEKQ